MKKDYTKPRIFVLSLDNIEPILQTSINNGESTENSIGIDDYNGVNISF